MQDARNGIVSRSIWAIGKLKRVQSNRDRTALTIGLGGAEAPGPEQGGGP